MSRFYDDLNQESNSDQETIAAVLKENDRLRRENQELQKIKMAEQI